MFCWKSNWCFFRPSTRRQGASVSYKENSAEETGSEDLVEVEWGQEAVAAAVESENAETIERIIDTRMGRKGGWFSFYHLQTWDPVVFNFMIFNLSYRAVNDHIHDRRKWRSQCQFLS
jgi:hypothetical protein